MSSHEQPVKKILMTTDTLGGVWQYSLELVEALSAHDVGVSLATMGAPLSRRQRAAVVSLPNVTVHESSYKLEWMDEPWADLRMAGKWLLGLETLLRPNVVHLNSYVHAALRWKAPKLVVAHSCVYSWFAAVRHQKPPMHWHRYRKLVSEGLRRADAVTAPTGAMLSAVMKHYGPLPVGKKIYNARKPQDYNPEKKESFVLTAGRLWDEAKNISALERIAPRLKWPVYAAGDAAHPNGGTAAFNSLCVLGMLDDKELARWMSRSSLYALPARYEPFGLSALEAALSGCALVLGDIPSLREIWDDAALFVPPDDDSALEAALNELIADNPLRTRLAQKARKRALQFSPQRMAEEYLFLYQHLFSQTGKPRVRNRPRKSPSRAADRRRKLRLQ